MQTACVEFARNVVGLAEANSSEFDPATPHRVIYKLRELRGVEELGGTMRLGAWTCKIEAGTLAHPTSREAENREPHPQPFQVNPELESEHNGASIANVRFTPGRHYRQNSYVPVLPT